MVLFCCLVPQITLNTVTIFCFVFPWDQVEHAHDNPLDEITLGEFNMAASMASDGIPPEKPITPKKMNLEIDQEPEVRSDVENDTQVEGKKMKKKDVKKEKAKRKTWTQRAEHVCVFFILCACNIKASEHLLLKKN